jgi:hypothetical protein|nr:MAG TPA: tail repeat-like protein [Caudoviricetes sp.]
MEPKYKINPLTGELQEYVFEYNGILVLRNFTAQVDNDRLVVRSASDVNFSILEALVSEVEIDGVLYDNPTAAKEALQRLVFNKNVPVILPEEERKKISSALQSGGYSGTAQDLKNLIDGINRILQSDDTDLDQLQEIVAYIKQNKKILSTLGISNIAGLADALAEKANKNHKHSWGDIEGKPNFSESITSKKFIKEGSSDEYLLTGGGGQVSKADLVSSGFKGNLSPEELNTFKYRDTGCWSVTYPGGWGLYVNFKGAGSTSSLEFLKSNWYPWTRIGVRNSVDGARFNDDKGAFRDLAWFSDVYREGAKCEGNTTLRVDHQNQVIFVTVACSIDLSAIQNMGSVSFRKVFDNGAVTFTCTGKTIKYTGDNTFNGKDGSTAVISIYDNTCYIDIRNI